MGIDGIKQVPRIHRVVVEILYLIGLTVVVTIAATVHANPDDPHRLAKFCTTTGKLRYGNRLLEILHVLGFHIHAVGSFVRVREPQLAVTVHKHTGNSPAKVLD